MNDSIVFDTQVEMDNLINMVEVFNILRAQYIVYQNFHWMTGNDYSTHLLFQRLYESVEVNTDKLAEKLFSMYGPSTINIMGSITLINKIIEEMNNCNLVTLNEKGADLEKRLQARIREINLDLVSPGLQDLIPAIASQSEENLYLLSP